MRDCETLYKHTLERSSFSLRLWRTFSGLCAPGTPAEPCRGGEIWTYASSEAGAFWVSWGAELCDHVLNTQCPSFGALTSQVRHNTVWKLRNLTALTLEPWP